MSDLAQAELSREQLEVLIPLLQAQKRQLGRGSELLVCDMLQKKKKGSTSTSAQYFAARREAGITCGRYRGVASLLVCGCVG